MPGTKKFKKIDSNILGAIIAASAAIIAAIIGVIGPALNNSCSGSSKKEIVQQINKPVDQPGKRTLLKPTQKIGQDEANDPFVYITKTGKKYHYRYCSYLKQSKIIEEIKLSEAKRRGYTPCSKCKPPP